MLLQNLRSNQRNAAMQQYQLTPRQCIKNCITSVEPDSNVVAAKSEAGLVLGWRRGVVVTALVVSTKLLYVEPG